MRLIDKDELIVDMVDDVQGDDTMQWYSKQQIESRPVVEAISIEYIEDWCNKERNYYDFKDFGKRLIDDWRKDNER